MPSPRLPRAAARLAFAHGALARLALAGGVLLAPAAARAQRFAFTPGPEVLSGDSLGVRVVGLAPGARVEVTAERLARGARPSLFAARATFAADSAGAVDLARAVPQPGGSYAGADPAGLFWAMRVDSTPGAPAPDTAGLGPGRVRLVARADGREVARAVVTVRASDPGVRVDSVPGFPGAVFARPAGPPPAGGRWPVLITLGGSEGGASTARASAPRFASRGYAVLGLPYYAPAYNGPSEFPALPRSFINIPVDRLEAARAWLAARPDVDVARLGLYGVSKGAEFALLAAVRYPWVRAVVAIAATDVVWQGWGPDGQGTATPASFAAGGRPLPFVPYAQMDEVYARINRGEPIGIRAFHDAGRRAFPDRAAAARIPVERYRGAVLVAGGWADQVWASGPMAQAVAERRAEHGLATTALVFPDAGHALSADGWGPTTGYGPGFGGTPAANARAQRETWAATLAFLARALGPAGPAPAGARADR